MTVNDTTIEHLATLVDRHPIASDRLVESQRWTLAPEASRLDQVLIEAAAIGATDIVRRALALGANAMAVGTAGPGMAMLLAALRGHRDIVVLLRRHDAPVSCGNPGAEILGFDPVTWVVVPYVVPDRDAAWELAVMAGHQDIADLLAPLVA